MKLVYPRSGSYADASEELCSSLLSLELLPSALLFLLLVSYFIFFMRRVGLDRMLGLLDEDPETSSKSDSMQ